MRAADAKQHGVRATWLEGVILQKQLERAAAEAQRRFRESISVNAMRSSVSCVYLGQRSDESSRGFVADCSAWRISGDKGKTIVTFRWHGPAGKRLEQDIRADNASERGLRLPRLSSEGALTDPGSSADLQQRLEAAAAVAQDRWGAWGREEHGRSISCAYLGRKE